MQKVVGSSPIIRVKKFLEISRFSRRRTKRPKSVARFDVAGARSERLPNRLDLRRAPGGNRGTKVPQIGQPHPRPVQDGVDARQPVRVDFFRRPRERLQKVMSTEG